MKLKKVITLGLVMGMSIFAVACGAKNSVKEQSNATATPVVQETVDATDKPVTEERVVVTSVAVVQILDALGIPMVGVPTSSYELPESVTGATKIGSAMSPDMEVIASLEPTIIVSVESLSEDLKKQFSSLQIESEFVNLNSYEGLKEAIATLGERFAVSDKANELIASLEKKEAAIQESIKGKEGPSVLIVFGAGSSFMAASDSSYVGNLASLVGAQNVVADAPSSFSPIDMEYLADKNPEYILFMAHANPEESLKAFEKEFETNDAWKNFDAVKNGKVVALETSYFGMSANLLAVDAMEQLVGILYGE